MKFQDKFSQFLFLGGSSSGSGCSSFDDGRAGREPGRGGALLKVPQASAATRVSGSSGKPFSSFNLSTEG
jgi:hypothetical protein